MCLQLGAGRFCGHGALLRGTRKPPLPTDPWSTFVSMFTQPVARPPVETGLHRAAGSVVSPLPMGVGKEGWRVGGS